MNKAAPWSIKGIGFDTREAAREAAQREGMSVGEWLNEVIAERAGDEPDRMDRDEDDIDAVSARLARMRDGGRARRRGEKRHRDNDDDRLEDFAAHRRRSGRALSRNASAREVSWRDEDPESLIESALEAYERRTSRGQDKTARALAEMVDVIESSQASRSREGRTLQSISRRLAEIEQKVTRGGDEARFRPIRGALSRIESRVDDLAHDEDAGRGDEGLRDIDSKLSEIATYLESGERNRPESDRLARIEAQLGQLTAQIAQGAQRQTIRAAAMETPAARPQAMDAVSQIMRRQRELDGDAPLSFAGRRPEARPPFDQRRAPSELETRLASIVERLERTVPQPDAAPPQAISGIQNDISRMAERLERMREEFAGKPSGGAEESIDLLRREVAAVSRGLGELAPRASVASLETAVHDIADRLHVARIEGVRDAVATPIEQLARELRASLRELDPRQAIGALEQDMRAISAKLDSLETRGGVDPQTIRAIFDQTREVRDLLSRAAVASHTGERAQRELDELAARLERTGGAGVAPADVARIVSDIRSVVQEGMGAEGLRALESRVEGLSQRIDAALSAGPGHEQMAVFGDRLDKLHRAVAQSLAAPRQAPTVETQHLEALVRELADKVDRASAPSAGREDLAALQAQIELLSRKIERTGGRDESVASLERMISDLFGQLSETRAAAFEAAEEAARAAARESVREALAGANTAGQGEISREIADLRAIQDASDQRTHATLKAVHATLERVVDRLATIEGDAGDAYAAPRREPVAKPASKPAAPAPRATAPVEAPQPDSTPHQGSTISAAAALARLKGEKVEPRVEARPQRAGPAAPSLDNDILIEPGAGRGARAAATDSDEGSPQAGFIAAARRAALAAQAASVAADEGEAVDAAEKSEAAGGRMAQARAVYERRRKPILLSLAALIGLLGALQIARVYTSRSSGLAPPPIVRPADPAPAPKAAPPRDENAAPAAPERGAEAPRSDAPRGDAPKGEAAPVGPKAEIAPPGDTSATDAAAPAPRRVDGPSNLPTMARQPRADAGPVDTAPVGSIQQPAKIVVPVAQLEKIAAQGDAHAQFELGARYADGNNAPRDLKAAARWFEKSAAKGVAPAQYRLGVLLERGLGVDRDLASARTWYERAAGSGNVRAMHNLAVLLADGGGKPDYTAAARWFRKAAEYGVRDSQYNLAILYARGMGGPQDLVQSYAWFSAAADQGDADAAKKRDDVATRFDAKTFERAKALAAGFRPKTPEPEANDVTPPAGGWQAQPAPKPAGKPVKPAISRL